MRIKLKQVDPRIKIEAMVNPTYFRALAQLFSPPSIRAMATGRLPGGMSELILESGLQDALPPASTHWHLLETLYGALQRQYRCEYLYKNAIARKILVGRHRLADATMATELRCDACKADFVILNGTSTVYEIKTELDNLDRLPRQLEAYRKMFDRIYVVTHPEPAKALWDLLDPDIGILVLTQKGTIRPIRGSEEHNATVDPGCIFDSLRKSEFMGIVEQHFGTQPSMPNTQHYKHFKAKFITLPPSVAHAEMVQALKARFRPGFEKSYLEKIPISLTAGFLSSQINSIQAESLACFMKAEYSLR